MIPLVHPEIFDAAVKICLEPDRKRLRVLLDRLERYLELTDDDLADETLTPSSTPEPRLGAESQFPQSPPQCPRTSARAEPAGGG